jgi:hypothetical protein
MSRCDGSIDFIVRHFGVRLCRVSVARVDGLQHGALRGLAALAVTYMGAGG